MAMGLVKPDIGDANEKPPPMGAATVWARPAMAADPVELPLFVSVMVNHATTKFPVLE